MERYVTVRTYTATYIGPSEFYTGLRTGARVNVQEEVIVYTSEDGRRKAKVSLSAAKVEGGAWMSLYDRIDKLTDIVEE